MFSVCWSDTDKGGKTVCKVAGLAPSCVRVSMFERLPAEAAAAAVP